MALFPVLTADGDTIVTSDGFAVVVGGSTPPSGGLFGPGTVVIYPDNEGSYVPGVVMDATSGALLGMLPNAVTYTADGACFLNGTCGVQQRQLSGTDWNFYVYDNNFNQLSMTTVFTGQHALGATPAPTTDYSTLFYVPSTFNPTPGQIRSVTAAGAVGGTTWTITGGFISLAVSTDNATFYYMHSNSLRTWDVATNTAGTTIYPAASLPSGLGFSSTIRLIPTRNTLCAVMNNLNTGFFELWQFTVTGTILTKTVLAGLTGNTDATMNVDLGAPSDFIYVRSYPGTDRLDGATVQRIRIDDGVVVNTFNAPVALADGGVADGYVPGTCPTYGWSGSGGIVSTSFPIRRLRRWAP